ncbi:MAG: hypothetical protein RLZZ370_1082 [Bacteroidota bacterium]
MTFLKRKANFVDMELLLIRNALVINEGREFMADVLCENGFIARIAPEGISGYQGPEIDATGKWLLPGVIDDQVHFREPGLTHKADIASESAAAAAGGVTTFMEMPNVKPPSTTIELLEEKYAIAARTATVNYSFFMGTTNENFEELMKVDPANICGIKIFMGSSTGNMLVDNMEVLERIFAHTPMLIATHCEDEARIRARTAEWVEKYGEEIPWEEHARIRDEEACLLSSRLAVQLAEKHRTRLHVLHISTAIETSLFRNDIPLSEKLITSEACVHHLHFSAADYAQLGAQIKCNPAIKDETNRAGVWKALLDDRIDIIATDHAPHTLEEKAQPYLQSPSGLPLVQHSLLLMLEHAAQGHISRTRLVEKMCHSPALCFRVKQRGFIRPGYYADLVLVDPQAQTVVNKQQLLYKCGWSPFEGHTFQHAISHTIVNGKIVWQQGKLTGVKAGARVQFSPEGWRA